MIESVIIWSKLELNQRCLYHFLVFWTDVLWWFWSLTVLLSRFSSWIYSWQCKLYAQCYRLKGKEKEKWMLLYLARFSIVYSCRISWTLAIQLHCFYLERVQLDVTYDASAYLREAGICSSLSRKMVRPSNRSESVSVQVGPETVHPPFCQFWSYTF